MMYEYLNKIENVGSTLEKEKLLKEMLIAHPKAEEFLRFTFSDHVWGIAEQTFYNALEITTKYPHVSDYFKDYVQCPTQELYSSIPVIIELINNNIKHRTGNALEESIGYVFWRLHREEAKWWCRGLLKDLRAGIQLKTVNKVFKALKIKPIAKFDVQLAGKFNIYSKEEWDKNIMVKNFALERKMNGNRLEAEVFPDGRVILMSRRGKNNTDKYPEICTSLAEMFQGEYHKFDGEIIAGDSTQKLSRKDDTTQRQYIIWDLLDDESLDYTQRWDNLFNLYNTSKLSSVVTNIQLVEHFNGICQQDAIDYFEHCFENGYEGIMIKLYNTKYERGTRKNMFKFKKDYDGTDSNDIDLQVIAWESGSGKLHNRIASLILTDASAEYTIKCGSGIKDEDREDLEKLHKEGKLIGSIVEIRYNVFTETGSLNFPRFIRIRDPSDKNYPDNLAVLDPYRNKTTNGDEI